MCLCRWVDVLSVFFVREEPVYEDVRCVDRVLAEMCCGFFSGADGVFGFSDVGGSGRSMLLSLAGSDSCLTDSVDLVVCSISAGVGSVCRVVEVFLDLSDVSGEVGSRVGCRRWGDGGDIAVYRIIVVPAMIPAAAYQRPGGDRSPSMNRRAIPLRTTNRAPRRPTSVIF
jgi:hypothetical protein